MVAICLLYNMTQFKYLINIVEPVSSYVLFLKCSIWTKINNELFTIQVYQFISISRPRPSCEGIISLVAHFNLKLHRPML